MPTFPFSSTELIYLVTELGIALLKFAFFIFLTWTIYEHWESSAKRKQSDQRFEAVKNLTIDKFKVWVETVHGKPSKAQQPSDDMVNALTKHLKDQQEVINKHHEELKKKCEEVARFEKICKKQEENLETCRQTNLSLVSENTTLRERFYDYASTARQYVTCYRDQTRFANSSDDWNEEKVVADMLERTDKIMEEFNYLPF